MTRPRLALDARLVTWPGIHRYVHELSLTMAERSDDRMPSWPIALPSVTVMVQNCRGVPPAEATPFFTACAWRISEMLQGAASFQAVATPISGWWICWVVRPMA